MTIIIVAALVVGIVLVVWFVRQRSSYMYILQAEIVAISPDSYSVSFQNLHPEAKPIEYVWLCLQLAAKLLYNIGNDPNQANAKRQLMELIRVLGETDMSNDVDLIEITGRSIQVTEKPVTSGKKIVAKLAYVNPITRLIYTSLPVTWFDSQFPDTFLAVVYTALPKLDELCRARLQGSLARMSEIYSYEADSSTLTALREVPHRAFIEAK